jgi:uncharacterized membrane protein YeaQ/YmgE (transglycosylase-associated protein family)
MASTPEAHAGLAGRAEAAPAVSPQAGAVSTKTFRIRRLYAVAAVGACLASVDAGGFTMTITLTGLLVLLIIAGICGALGRALGGGTGGGFIVSIAIGFVGALIGMFVAGALRLPEILAISIDGRPFPIVWSIIGGALLVALVNMVTSRPMGSRWRYR